MVEIYKVDKNNNVLNSSNSRYVITKYISCGSYFHSNKKHMFKSDKKEDIEILLFIIEKLNICKISNITPNSFIFEAINLRTQKFIFKLCRYVRSEDMFSILLTIKEMIDNGVKPYNSVYLSHFKNQYLNGYYRNMDLFNIEYGYVKKGFKDFESFKSNLLKSGLIQSIFHINRNLNKNNLYDLVIQNKFIEAEKYILQN